MSGPYLLDTSVFSQPLRRQPVDSALIRWRDAGDTHCAISIVTDSEIKWGLHLEGSEVRWKKFRTLLEGRLSVLPTGAEVWDRFASMKAQQQKKGQMVDDLDLLIAATATFHHLTVATLNHRDFSRIEGVAWENWGML